MMTAIFISSLIFLYFLQAMSFASSTNRFDFCHELLESDKGSLKDLIKDYNKKNLNVTCIKKFIKKRPDAINSLKHAIIKNLETNLSLLDIALVIKDQDWIDELARSLKKEKLCILYESVLKDSLDLGNKMIECPRASRILNIIFSDPKPTILEILPAIKKISKKKYSHHFFDELSVYLSNKSSNSLIRLGEYIDETNEEEVRNLFEAIRRQLTLKAQRGLLESSFPHYRQKLIWEVMAQTLLTKRSRKELDRLISVFFIINLKEDTSPLIQLASLHHKEPFSAVIWKHLFSNIIISETDHVKEVVKVIDQVNGLKITPQSFYVFLRELIKSGIVKNESAYKINNGSLQEMRVATIWKSIVSSKLEYRKKYIEYLLNSDKYQSTHHWSNYKKALIMNSKFYKNCAEIIAEFYKDRQG